MKIELVFNQQIFFNLKKKTISLIFLKTKLNRSKSTSNSNIEPNSKSKS